MALNGKMPLVTEPFMVGSDWFKLDPVEGGNIRLTWSLKGEPDPDDWDPLDFWVIPGDEIPASIAKVRTEREAFPCLSS